MCMILVFPMDLSVLWACVGLPWLIKKKRSGKNVISSLRDINMCISLSRKWDSRSSSPWLSRSFTLPTTSHALWADSLLSSLCRPPVLTNAGAEIPSSGAFIHQVSFLGLADAEQIQLCAARLWAPAAAAAWSWVLLRAPYELNKRGSRIWRRSLRRATRASAAKLAAISLNLILLLLNTTFTCCTRCDAPVSVALCYLNERQISH